MRWLEAGTVRTGGCSSSGDAARTRSRLNLGDVFGDAFGDAFGEVYYTIQGAVTTFENLHAGGAPGHKIVATEPTIINTPFVLHQAEGLSDMIVGAIKHRGPISYFYGVYADKVKEFKPPSKSVDFHEEQMWSTMKTNQATVRTISNLENTESAKLKDRFIDILKLTPTFSKVGLYTLNAFVK